MRSLRCSAKIRFRGRIWCGMSGCRRGPDALGRGRGWRLGGRRTSGEIAGRARNDGGMLKQVQHDGEIAGQARNDGCMYFGVLAFGVVRVWEKPPPVLP